MLRKPGKGDNPRIWVPIFLVCLALGFEAYSHWSHQCWVKHFDYNAQYYLLVPYLCARAISLFCLWNVRFTKVSWKLSIGTGTILKLFFSRLPNSERNVKSLKTHDGWWPMWEMPWNFPKFQKLLKCYDFSVNSTLYVHSNHISIFFKNIYKHYFLFSVYIRAHASEPLKFKRKKISEMPTEIASSFQTSCQKRSPLSLVWGSAYRKLPVEDLPVGTQPRERRHLQVLKWRNPHLCIGLCGWKTHPQNSRL